MAHDDRTGAETFQTIPSVPDHEILRRIGGGGYGEVWLARSVVGTYRAVKFVFRNKFTEAAPYEREFNGIRKFEPISRSDDGLVDILQIGRNDSAGYFYYVMELADDQSNGQAIDPVVYVSKTLQRELELRPRLPVDECLQIGLSLAKALQYLHEQGLIHRDIKPSNIIYLGGVLKLADIGLVTEAGEMASFVGTPGFIPPEGPGTAQADLFSLGKVLYQITMGKDPRNFPDPVTDLALLPDRERLLGMNAIILKACRSSIGRRYQSAKELHDDLASLQNGGATTRSRRMIAGSVGVMLMMAATLGTFLYFKQPRSTAHPVPQAVSTSPSPAVSLKPSAHANELSSEEIAAGFKLLFNGKDLSGWEGDSRFWSIEDGSVVASNQSDAPRPRVSFLIWQGGNVSNFELHLAFKSESNSGIGYRNRLTGDHTLYGYQAEISPEKAGTGRCFATQPRKDRPLAAVGQRTTVHGLGEAETIEVTGTTAKAEELTRAYKPGDWNEYVILARNNRFTHWINGVLFIDATDDNPSKFAASGFLGLEFSPRHAKGGKVQFKSIRFKPLDP